MKIFTETEKLKTLYNDRYSNGGIAYMDEWKSDEKDRIKEIIKNIKFSKKGRALDFGCGNGVFVKVLAEALPEWIIVGCDASEVAIQNAKQRYPQYTFFVSASGEMDVSFINSFDLVFSHHVLEHVGNIVKTAEEINEYLKPRADMIHVLPCGNKGSLEWNICQLHKNGIDKNCGNRFFYEDIGHLRRLTTDDMDRLFCIHGFHKKYEYYNNIYWGAIFWITNNGRSIIQKLTDTNNAISASAGVKLSCYKFIFLILYYLQIPYKWYRAVKVKKDKCFYHKFFLIADFLPQLCTGYIPRFIRKKADKEWNNDNNKKNGSSMYLHYVRNI
jgi:SAM-dependent methyltransferase